MIGEYALNNQNKQLNEVITLQQSQQPQNVEGTPFSKLQMDEQQSNASSVVARSKSRHLVVMNNLKKREEMWDNRFYLQQIPKFPIRNDEISEEVIQEIHLRNSFQVVQQNKQFTKLILLNYQLNKSQSIQIRQIQKLKQQTNRNQVEFAPGRIRKKLTKDSQILENDGDKSTQSAQSQQRQLAPPYYNHPGGPAGVPHPKKLIPPNFDQLKEMIKDNFEKLKMNWETMDIPIHHRQLSRERAIELIISELEDLKKGDAFIQNCQKALKGREQCILQMEDEIILIEKEQNNITEENLSKCSELITHMRLLSINAVECIISWRNYLMEFLQSSINKDRQVMIIPYLYKDVNYLIKMRTDTHFIRSSVLKNYFFFSMRQEFKIDPFILSMTDTNEQTDKQVQFISKNLRKRIDNCIQLLNEEYLRVMEDDKFQQANSKKPSYSRYQQKLPGVAPIRKSSQNSRVVNKQISQDQYTHQQQSNKKDPHSPSSSIQSKQSPQKQLNFDNSPSRQKYDYPEIARKEHQQNSQYNIGSQSEISEGQQQQKGSVQDYKYNENINKNQQNIPQQHGQQKSSSSINQSNKGSLNSSNNISLQQKNNINHTVNSHNPNNNNKDILNSSKSQPNHPSHQQQQIHIQQKTTTTKMNSQDENIKKSTQSTHSIPQQHNQKSEISQDSQQLPQKTSENVIKQSKPESIKHSENQQLPDKDHQKSNISDDTQKQKQNEVLPHSQDINYVLEKEKPVDTVKLQDNAQQGENNKIENKKNEQEEESEGKIQVPDYGEADLIKYTEDYLKSVEKKIKESVLSSIQEISRRMRTEYECGCLEYLKNGKLKGIVYYFNESSQQSRRITLMHVSAVDEKNLDEFLNQLIKYIFENDPCDEIRFCIYHHENEEGNMQVHKDIQTIFTSKGFKWKQVNNDKYTHQRTTILALRRPASIPSTIIFPQYDHILVSSLAIIQSNQNNSITPNNNLHKMNFDMTVNLLGSFDQTIQEDTGFANILAESGNKSYEKNLEQINFLMRKNYKYSDMKKEVFEDKQSFSDALKTYEIKYDTTNLNPSSKIFSSVSKLALKWRAFSQCTIQNDLYFRMNIPQADDHNFMKANSKINKTVYILPTDDQNTNIFLFEIQNKEEFIDNFSQNVKDVMKSLKDTQQMKEDLFIPAFDFKKECNQIIQKESSNPKYSSFQSLNISINYKTPLPKIKIDIQKQSSATAIIKPPFVFGFINTDIDDILEIPYYSSLIEESDCIKV